MINGINGSIIGTPCQTKVYYYQTYLQDSVCYQLIFFFDYYVFFFIFLHLNRDFFNPSFSLYVFFYIVFHLIIFFFKMKGYRISTMLEYLQIGPWATTKRQICPSSSQRGRSKNAGDNHEWNYWSRSSCHLWWYWYLEMTHLIINWALLLIIWFHVQLVLIL